MQAYLVGETLFVFVLLWPPSLILWQWKIGESRNSNLKGALRIGAKTFAHPKKTPALQYAAPKVTKYQRCNFIIQIHQFTIKIDKININLLFECVKIVEFNFNSHVFHVMYQETRFLNQDACFLNQEGRRQFLISFVSERDWNQAYGLEVLTGLYDSSSSQIDWS